jgi:hypothetical protein
MLETTRLDLIFFHNQEKKVLCSLLDSPKAYTDYSKNYFRIIPEGYKIEEITHGTNANPNLISVNKVIENIIRLKN